MCLQPSFSTLLLKSSNLYLMAKEENSSINEDKEVYDLYTFDELQDAFDDLSSRFEKLSCRHIALKNNFSKLEAKVKALEKERDFNWRKICFEEKCWWFLSYCHKAHKWKGKSWETFGFSNSILVQARLRLQCSFKEKDIKNRLCKTRTFKEWCMFLLWH